MFHLMKSEKFMLNHAVSGSMSTYRQTEVDHFLQLDAALEACETAGIESRTHYYVLNDLGQEYYNKTWID